MFLGEYYTNFTGKGRLILPRKLRDELAGKEIVLSRGFEGCIWGFSKEGFEELAKKQIEVSATEERARNLRRYLFSGSESVELDTQGRFVVPSALLTFARVKKEAVIVGAGDHFEIWDARLWGRELAKIKQRYGRLS